MESTQYPKVYLYRRVVQAKLFMDQHYGEQMDVDNISDEAHFSKFHFIRLFKSIYGTTPHQYLKEVRIQKAKELLCTETTVKEVCFSVGFESVSSFSGLFKRSVGLSPRQYFKQQKERREQAAKTPLAFVPGCYAHQHGWYENSNFGEEE